MSAPGKISASMMVPVMLLITAVAHVLGLWASLHATAPARCMLHSCALTMMASTEFWGHLLLLMLVLGTLLLAVVPASCRYRHAWAARLWPVYAWLGTTLLLALIGFLDGLNLLRIAPEIPIRLYLGMESSAYAYVVVSALPEALAALFTWFVVSKCCFASAETPSPRSRNHQALLFCAVLATLSALVFTLVHLGAMWAGSSDYSRMVHRFTHATGIHFTLLIPITCLLLSLPAWALAWRCDSGNRGRPGTIVGAILAFLISLPLAGTGAVLAALYADEAHNLTGASWMLLGWWLAANAIATWLACWLIHPREHRHAWHHAAAVSCGVVLACIYGAAGILLAAMANLTGPQPPKRMVADKPELPLVTYLQKDCSGTVRTGNGLWLVGVHDGMYEFDDLQEDPSAYSLTAGPDGKHDGPPRYITRDRSYTTLARFSDARRSENRSFERIAYMPSNGCLIAVPDSHRMLLLTRLRHRGSDSLNNILYVSDDGGRHWSERRRGLIAGMDMSPSGNMAYPSKNRLWVWNRYASFDAIEDEDFTFSSDGGRSIEPIHLPNDFITTWSDIAPRLPSGSRLASGGTRARLYVTEQHPGQAILWASQRITYILPDGEQDQAYRTDALVLKRVDHAWKVDKIRHFEHLYISQIVQPPSAPAWAIVSREAWHLDDHIALLDPAKAQWDIVSGAPSPIWPLGGSEIEDMWASDEVVVVAVDAGSDINAVYYSRDGGDDWDKLAIAERPGVLGLDPKNHLLYFKNPGASPIEAFDLSASDHGRQPES